MACEGTWAHDDRFVALALARQGGAWLGRVWHGSAWLAWAWRRSAGQGMEVVCLFDRWRHRAGLCLRQYGPAPLARRDGAADCLTPVVDTARQGAGWVRQPRNTARRTVAGPGFDSLLLHAARCPRGNLVSSLGRSYADTLNQDPSRGKGAGSRLPVLDTLGLLASSRGSCAISSIGRAAGS